MIEQLSQALGDLGSTLAISALGRATAPGSHLSEQPLQEHQCNPTLDLGQVASNSKSRLFAGHRRARAARFALGVEC